MDKVKYRIKDLVDYVLVWASELEELVGLKGEKEKRIWQIFLDGLADLLNRILNMKDEKKLENSLDEAIKEVLRLKKGKLS